MKKILIINTIGFGYEGISTVILNYFSFMNKDDLDIHFLCYKGMNDQVLDRIKTIGTAHEVVGRKDGVKAYIKGLNSVLNEKFDVIHINGNSATMCIETVLAKLHGVKNVIIHGHSTATDYPLFNNLMSPVLMLTSNRKLACSQAVGDFLYKNHSYTVINNAVDVERFTFNREKRDYIRDELNLNGSFVIGHVGYFSDNKNQLFLLKVLSEIKKHGIENVKLLFVGNYFEDEKFSKALCDYGLNKEVIVIPANKNVEMYYSAMDMFSFPSKFEGQGLVLTEAQTNGLDCVASLGVPQSGNVSGNVEFIDIEDMDSWTSQIISLINNVDINERMQKSLNNGKKVSEHGYDIRLEAEKLKNFYVE